MNVYAVLMAGGVGTRFWPRSRRKTPKQVLNIVDESTMIQATYARLSGLVSDEHILIVTNAEQKEIIAEQLPQLKDENFILEPFGRNTAPCIGLAAVHIARHDPDAVMVVLPADHVVSKVKEYQTVLKLAIEYAAEHEALVTIGITPNEPVTGYGYIQAGEAVGGKGKHQIHHVKTFAEKPNLETAIRFLDSGDFFWNSGMFIWRASTILKEIKEKLPETFEKLGDVQKAVGRPDYDRVLEESYRAIKNVSIDIGVMQRARQVFVIPADIGWNDVGSWETVYEISPKDRHQNAAQTHELINIASKQNYVYSPEKVVALVGVEDLVIVDTGDALLVCNRANAQQVKDAVDLLAKKGKASHL